MREEGSVVLHSLLHFHEGKERKMALPLLSFACRHKEGGNGRGILRTRRSLDASFFSAGDQRERVQRGHSPLVYTEK